MASSTIKLTAADGFEFSAYVAEPAGTPRGAVVVIQEIFGVNSHIRSVADGYAPRVTWRSRRVPSSGWKRASTWATPAPTCRKACA